MSQLFASVGLRRKPKMSLVNGQAPGSSASTPSRSLSLIPETFQKHVGIESSYQYHRVSPNCALVRCQDDPTLILQIMLVNDPCSHGDVLQLGLGEPLWTPEVCGHVTSSSQASSSGVRFKPNA